ncbi:MAG: hypothetical protein AB7G15_14395 [Alphaproteobacteria bacterium]
MSRPGRQPLEINLVGSVPLADSESVFRTLADGMGPRIKRLPDGETGPLRSKWILCQIPVFKENPAFDAAPPTGPLKYSVSHVGQLKPGIRPEEIRFDNLNYADWAVESYQTFHRLKRAGVVAADCRFQVALPTPYAVVNRLVDASGKAAVEPHYHRAMKREVTKMLRAIPAAELALQIDVCQEIGIWEGMWKSFLEGGQATLIERVADLAAVLPADAELGYHLCYGDFNHKHFLEPKNAEIMVDIINQLALATRRRIDWVHMPVPRERADDDYFRPLAKLHLPEETSLFLGLVHMTDGAEGSLRRIAVARRHVKNFGIATECGWGRRASESIRELIRLHVAVSDGAVSP